jgi:ADP-ribosylglycohydrolase
MIDSNEKTAVMAAFLADSLALGAHWIYDTEAVAARFGTVASLMKPGPDSFHANKEKGAFTHYGDQMLVLLQSVAAREAFDLRDFSDRWRDLFDGYSGYVDQATRGTLSGYASGAGPEEAGSPSDDLAGASRMAPLLCLHGRNPDKLVEACVSQTRMTHNSPTTVASAEFFARVGYHVLDGLSPVVAIEKVSEEWSGEAQIPGWVRKGLESREAESVGTIVRFGQTCHTPDAFPGVIHLIARYESDLKEALAQSVMAGGDSAARGIMVGMVLGAHLGPESLPEAWLSELEAREEIEALLDQIP